MKGKKENRQEVIFTEIAAWAFVAAVIYIFIKITF
jgi:hypothetical protein